MTAETDLRQLFYARCRQLTRKLVTKTKNSPVFVVSYETAQTWPSHDKHKTYWTITVVDQVIKITSSKIHTGAVFHFLQAGLSVQRANTQVSVVNISICPHLLCWNNVTASAHPLKLNLHLYKNSATHLPVVSIFVLPLPSMSYKGGKNKTKNINDSSVLVISTMQSSSNSVNSCTFL